MRSDEEIYEAARAKCAQTKKPPFPWKVMRDGREVIKSVIAEARSDAKAELALAEKSDGDADPVEATKIIAKSKTA